MRRNDDKCPWSECNKLWSEHKGLEKVVHHEKSIYSAPPKMPGRPNGCRCPVLNVGDYCPIHGG